MGKIRFSFKSLYNNQVILDERKSKPWWLALIFFILSLGLIATPLLVSGYSTKGSAVLNGNTLNEGLTLFSQKLKTTNTDCRIGEDDPVIYFSENVTASNEADPKPMKIGDEELNLTMTYIDSEGKSSVRTYLSVYYFNELDPWRVAEDNTKLTEIVDKHILVKDTEGKYVTVPNSLLLITQTTMRIYSFKMVDATVETTASNIMEGVFRNLKGVQITPTVDASDYNEFWSDFLTKAYQPIQVTQTWMTTGITTGLSAIVMLFICLLIFLFTRGKNNMYRDINFLDAMKISAFMSLSPAIITLVLTFVMPSLGSMAFIAALGARAMFLIMKTSSNYRPNNGQAPVYQARS